MNNLIGLMVGLVYVLAFIGIAEILGRQLGYSSYITRKVVHIGMGFFIWLAPFLFDSPWFFVIGALAFAILTYLDWRFSFFPSMASSNRSNLGTVYFPIALVAVALVFWDQPPIMVAALMPLVWGDGLASVVGRTYGTNTYVVFNQQKSYQGSITFFITGGFFTWLALWIMPGNPMLSPAEAILPTLVTITACTITEAVSPWGLDNLTVTTVAMFILGLWLF